ncbi:MAG: helix-turn-helix transcriptional regulator [Caldilineaceae bacterium]
MSVFLNEELNKRGWSQRELARRANLSPTSISEVMASKRGPGKRFCQAVAKALQVPPERIFQAAGIIDPPPTTQLFTELTTIAKSLNEQNQKKLIEYAQFLLQTER